MKKLITLCLVLAALGAVNGVTAADEAKSETPTVSKAEKKDFSFTITLDYRSAPEMEGWMKAMQALCNEWYPKLIDELDSPGFKPYKRVSIAVKSDPNGVAGTGGSHIGLSKEYFSKNGTDAGAVIHELVHVVQAYPKYVPWITEGIADYIRLYKFEPNAPRPKANPDRINLKRGYKGTAAFLAWVVDEVNPETVKKLNAALREGTYEDSLFKEITGKTLDELVAEYVKSLKKQSGNDSEASK